MPNAVILVGKCPSCGVLAAHSPHPDATVGNFGTAKRAKIVHEGEELPPVFPFTFMGWNSSIEAGRHDCGCRLYVEIREKKFQGFTSSPQSKNLLAI